MNEEIFQYVTQIVVDEFDSALHEQRKLKVFDLYARELERKLLS